VRPSIARRLVQRVQTGYWGQTTDTAALDAATDALPGLGGGNFADFQPTKLIVQSNPFDRR
jgi:hypothetical protein